MPISGNTRQRLAAALTLESAANEVVNQLDNPVYTGNVKHSVANGVAAAAGGGQVNATLLTRDFNRITTCATGGDSVKLPPAVAGLEIVVINNVAVNSANVFPSSGGVINALAPDAGFSVATAKTCVFRCVVNGFWNSQLGA